MKELIIDKDNLKIVYDGKELTITDMQAINNAYGQLCTYEYLLDNNPNFANFKQVAWLFAMTIRNYMNDNNCTESEAIEELSKSLGNMVVEDEE